jgi:hypothetical protein
MDDRFLNQLRGEPPAEFARTLRERLRAREESRRGLAAPTLAAVAAAALVVALFTLPSVRASAQAMLDLFRVRRFAAVEFDASRLEKLKALKEDKELLVFDRQQTMKEPGPAQYYPTPEAAGAAAGLQIRRPGYLPNGLAPDSVFVQGAGEARLAVSEAKLRTLLQQLDLHDVEVPPGLDGKWIDVRKPPVVIQTFESGALRAGLVQAVSPEVSVPAGLDVVGLAEIGLRVLGLDAGEARRIARGTDWRSTFLVPVPINASTFRQVTIHGQPGLLITTSGASSEGRRHREGSVLMWTEDDRVFALTSNLGSGDLVQMAESVR